MWICRHCGLEVPDKTLAPEEDSEGYYFVCPNCEGRNRLTDAAEDDDEGSGGLVQPDV